MTQHQQQVSFDQARKVTHKDFQALEEAHNELQIRVGLIEGYLRNQDAAYGGTPLDYTDPDYVEPEVQGEVVE